jgi:hypothetical protein
MQLRSSVQSHRWVWVPRLRLLLPGPQESLQGEWRQSVAELPRVACASEQSYGLEQVVGSLPAFLFLQYRNRNLRRPHLVEAETVGWFFSRGRLVQLPHKRH